MSLAATSLALLALSRMDSITRELCGVDLVLAVFDLEVDLFLGGGTVDFEVDLVDLEEAEEG